MADNQDVVMDGVVALVAGYVPFTISENFARRKGTMEEF
jgi:hypothetical protein